MRNSAEPSEDSSARIPLVMDDREGRGAMPAALSRCDAFDVSLQRLALGDYRVDSALLFERKTLMDLVASIEEGRLFSQALRLAESGRSAALLLEGTGRDLVGCKMRWEAIQGALVNVSLFIGLPILRSCNADDTVRTMLYAARQHRAVAGGCLIRRGARPKGKLALQNHILQGLPGIGPHRATRLLDRFGSVSAVMAAQGEVLQEVEGIGTSTARKLRWAVEEPKATYLERRFQG